MFIFGYVRKVGKFSKRDTARDVIPTPSSLRDQLKFGHVRERLGDTLGLLALALPLP